METNTASSDETYIFESDTNVVDLIVKLAGEIGIEEDDDDAYEAFEAEMHLLLNKHTTKK